MDILIRLYHVFSRKLNLWLLLCRGAFSCQRVPGSTQQGPVGLSPGLGLGPGATPPELGQLAQGAWSMGLCSAAPAPWRAEEEKLWTGEGMNIPPRPLVVLELFLKGSVNH